MWWLIHQVMLLCDTIWMACIFYVILLVRKSLFLLDIASNADILLTRHEVFPSQWALVGEKRLCVEPKECLQRRLSWIRRRKNCQLALSNSVSPETCVVLKNPHCNKTPSGFASNSVVRTEFKGFPIHLTCPFSDIHYNRNHHECKICKGMAVEEAQGCKSSCVLFSYDQEARVSYQFYNNYLRVH